MAKMMVDHFVDFKGCSSEEHIYDYDEMDLSMSEFVEKREEILDHVPEFAEPDFALEDRLPWQARLSKSKSKWDCKDDWEKHLKEPLAHMTERRWKRKWRSIEHLFTGGTQIRRLCIGKDDDISRSRSTAERRTAQGKATVDIDSILAMFTDLSVIATAINICITPQAHKNLTSNIHLAHRGIPVHHIPHFCLGSFGHDPKYDLFVLLPELYKPNVKRTKVNLYNHVREDIRAKFMNECFLHAVKQVVNSSDSQSWDFLYEVAKTKSTASAREGNKYKLMMTKPFRQEIRCDLERHYIPTVWRICKGAMEEKMAREGTLKAFRGFQFLINAKGYKHRLKADRFSQLMQIYKTEVSLTFFVSLGSLCFSDRKQLRPSQDRRPSILFGCRDHSYFG